MYDFARYLNIRSAHTPVVSPDGARLAFLTDITGNFQVWSVALDHAGTQTWPRQLTYLPDKVWELHGTDRANHLIAVSDSDGNERQQFYLISNYGIDDSGAVQHEVRRITTDDDAIHRFGDWSQDGQSIVYTSNARNNVDFDIYRIDLQTGQSHMVRQCEGRRQVVAWTGDDGYVLSTDALATEEIDLYLLDVQHDHEIHLTQETSPARYGSVICQDGNVYLISDKYHDRGTLCRLTLPDGALSSVLSIEQVAQHVGTNRCELNQVFLSHTGKTALLTINADGYDHLFVLDLQGVVGDEPLPAAHIRHMSDVPAGVIEHLTFGESERSVFFDLQSPVLQQDVWTLDVVSGRTAKITHSDGAGIDVGTFVRPNLVHYLTFDNRQIPAYLFLPQQDTPPSGFACILYVHGGPAGQQRPDFDVRFQYFLNEGYALLVPNVRGSTGYGREYMMLDDVEKRMDSVADLQAAVTWLQNQDAIDGSRIAIYGRSYGGFMVLAALTEYPEVLAAGIDVVGIADWETFLERTSPWRRAHREREYGSLANHRELLRQLSPLHKADRIKAPLLVIAGDNDPRVPLYESQQIVEKVQAAGGVVVFKHYADEGHKISKLTNRIDSFATMAAFLQQHIGDKSNSESVE